MPNQNRTPQANNKTTAAGSGQGTSAQTAPDRNTPPELNVSPDSAESSVEKMKDTGKSLLEGAKATASEAYSSVADKAASTIEEQKAGLTGGLTSAAETVRRVSGTISEGDSQGGVSEYAARYTETAAQKLEDAAQYFDRTDLKGIARDVESFARRNPAIFLGTAFALGVLAARFIKSGPSPLAIDTAMSDAPELSPAGMGEWENGAAEARTGSV